MSNCQPPPQENNALTKRMRLKIAMIKHGLSVERLASVTGRSIHTVYKWTGGERQVPDAILSYVEIGDFNQEIAVNG